jgi:hypothetical protein
MSGQETTVPGSCHERNRRDEVHPRRYEFFHGADKSSMSSDLRTHFDDIVL